jgi:hypothetical protein
VTGRSLPALDRPEGWPVVDPAAFYGPLGEFVTEAAPYTEADPVAILATLLSMFGVAIGREPFMLAGNEPHRASLFVVVTGPTAAGAKGTSAGVARAFMSRVDPTLEARTLSGFGSGESLIDSVSDPGEDDDDLDTVDRGSDRRLWIHEPEFARVLKAASRDGSTLSMVLRDGYDGRPLQARSRARTSVASAYHLGAVGHITPEELRARVTETEIYGGFVNRFMFVLSHRRHLLPDGGNVPDDLLDLHAERLRDRLHIARSVRRMTRSASADELWREIYVDIAHDAPDGLLGAIVGRAAPHVMRLGMTFALTDSATEVSADHLAAAWALWRFCRCGAEAIFGDRVGDDVADKLLKAIKRAGSAGLDLTGQSAAVGRHVKAARLKAARERLEAEGRIVTETVPTDGRPRTVSRLVAKQAEEARKAPLNGSSFADFASFAPQAPTGGTSPCRICGQPCRRIVPLDDGWAHPTCLDQAGTAASTAEGDPRREGP